MYWQKKKIVYQTKHMFITNTQTSIGYVNNYDKNRYLLKFWKAFVLILNYLIVKMYLLFTCFMSNSAVFFVAMFHMLSCRGGGQAVQASLSCPQPTWVSK